MRSSVSFWITLPWALGLSVCLACSSHDARRDGASDSEPRSDREEAAPSPTPPHPVPGEESSLEQVPVSTFFSDPSGHALTRFHEALRSARAGERTARVAVYGASHVAGDLYVGPLRNALQASFGDGGHGFVMAAWPTLAHAYWQSGAQVEPGEGWASLRLGRGRSVPDQYGMAGVVFDSEGREANATIRTEGPGFRTTASAIEVWFQRQPGGGTLEVYVDDTLAAEISTDGVVGPGYHPLRVLDAPHSVRVRAVPGHSVRLYGVTFERDGGGVVVDNVALTGSKARYQLKWLDPVYSDHLRRRDPALVVIAYGGNEGNDFDIPVSTYAARMGRVVRRIRRAVPNADCLIVGPADKPLLRGDEWVHRHRTSAIARSQRSLAEATGCAFFDTVAFMGGRMSMLEWVAADPPLARADHVHFSRAGYRLLSRELLSFLVPRPEEAQSLRALGPSAPLAPQ